MEYFTKKEIEARHYTTLKNVFITLMILIGLVILVAVLLMQQGYSPRLALYEGFHLVTHFPKFSHNSLLVSLASLAGAFLVLFIILTFLSIIYGGGLKYELKEGRKMTKIKELKNHVIVCGANIIGNNVSVKLDAERIPFVVVDDDLKGLAEPRNKEFLVIEGNPIDEEVLKSANIGKASVLVAVLKQEGANMLLSSLAKKLNPKIKVVASTDHSQYVEHMEKIGADLVMMPEVLGAFKIADVVQDILGMEKKK